MAGQNIHLCGFLLTIDPSDAHRLKNSEKQQSHPSAGVVIKQLEDVEAALQVESEGKKKSSNTGGSGGTKPWWMFDAADQSLTPDLCHHQKTHEEAPDWDCQEEEFTSAWVLEDFGIHVADGRHQSLLVDKLKEGKKNWCEGDVGFFFFPKKKKSNTLFGFTSLSNPTKMIIMKKKMAQSCGSGIRATARGKAMKARPGPAKRRKKRFFFSLPFC